MHRLIGGPLTETQKICVCRNERAFNSSMATIIKIYLSRAPLSEMRLLVNQIKFCSILSACFVSVKVKLLSANAPRDLRTYFIKHYYKFYPISIYHLKQNCFIQTSRQCRMWSCVLCRSFFTVNPTRLSPRNNRQRRINGPGHYRVGNACEWRALRWIIEYTVESHAAKQLNVRPAALHYGALLANCRRRPQASS